MLPFAVRPQLQRQNEGAARTRQTNNSRSPQDELFKRLNGKVRSFKFTRHAFRRQFIIPAICIRCGNRLGDRCARYTIFLVRLSRLDANTHTLTRTDLHAVSGR